ncbi:MAG: hypothetical protein PHC61_14900, partial [Chitinivibrionales bacterium]|nr:hypothetical protein [Chitinivibrionales bacterium]
VVDTSSQLNHPVILNQKVPVYVIAPPVTPLQAAPVPFKTTFNNPNGTNLILGGPTYNTYYQQYRQWVRNQGSGTVLTFKIAASMDPNDSVKAQLYIYDVVGNLVNASTRPYDLLPKEFQDAPGSARDFDIYWNGVNAKGMKVAPGVYRVLLYLQTKSGKKQRLVGTVGIK